MAASIATQEATWLRYLTSDMGYGDLRITEFGKLCEKDYENACLSKWFYSSERPISLFNDNKACIHLSKDPLYHKRSRHIHIRYGYVRDQSRAGHIDLAYIPTGENIADLMTKHLKKATHDHLCDRLLFKLHDNEVYRYDGNSIVGDFPTPVTEDLTAPDLSRYRLLRPMSLSFCDSEDQMRAIRALAPSVFPADHDEVTASHEASRGSPGCSCSVCCDKRKALHRIILRAPMTDQTHQRPSITLGSLKTAAVKNLIDTSTKTSKPAVSKTKDPVKDLVSRLRNVPVSAA